MKKYIDLWPLATSIIGLVFGYGVLNNKVEALEKKDADEKLLIRSIESNVVEIREDVSFIKGKLEHLQIREK